MSSSIEFIWRDPAAGRGFRSGICLHGHTFHSKECLSFLPTYLKQVPGLAPMVRRHQKRFDFARAYWTPPLTPSSAWHLEAAQISALGLRPVVSLTDHDDIEAGMSLAPVWDRAENPVSVEWTVPYEGSIFHFGIHNLPRQRERDWMKAMAEFTAAPAEERLPSLLESLAADPAILVVLNHPFWLEEGVEEAAHERALPNVLDRCIAWIHALELNGTRRWKENRRVIDLASRYARPVISGGDRHACEPAACINLTRANSFSGFVEEIRKGHSSILFLPQYQEPMPARILDAAWDILRPYPEYPDREFWPDRIYYTQEDGVAKPVSAIWGKRAPWLLSGTAGLVEFLASRHLRPAMRLLLAERGESFS